jgi:outer membrane protein TolC
MITAFNMKQYMSLAEYRGRPLLRKPGAFYSYLGSLNGYTLLLLIGMLPVKGQEVISLDSVMRDAQMQSLDAYKAKNLFLADYWSFQSYLSKQKPHLLLNFSPIAYNRNYTARYDFETNVEVYRYQQTLNSYSSLSLSQNLVATGGSIYVESDLYRLQNFGDINVTSWNSTPFRIGIYQPLFAYNSYKWQKRISPLIYEKARQEYVQSLQELNIKAVELYFDLLLSSEQMNIAARNIESSVKLCEIGKQRFEIASIQQEELLDLELSKYNAEIEYARAEKLFQKAAFNLRSFLSWPESKAIQPVAPEILQNFQIDTKSAVELAKALNPEIMNLDQRRLEAESALEKARKDEKFKAGLNASYGLNQSANEFNRVYQDPLNQQTIALTLSIPLLDWGDRRGQREVAQNQKEVVDIEVKQAMIDFEQQVILKVIDFNLQARMVESARQADQLARQSFELTQKRFVMGNADVLKLTSSMKAMQLSGENYINSLAAYWQYYYEVQKLTLYDFFNQKPLSASFDEMIHK